MITRLHPLGDRLPPVGLPDSRGLPRSFFSQLFFTDSGHYLLPTVDFNTDGKRQQHRLRHIVRKYFDVIIQGSRSSASARSFAAAGATHMADAGEALCNSALVTAVGESNGESSIVSIGEILTLEKTLLTKVLSLVV